VDGAEVSYEDYPTYPVQMNHLDTMGMLMILTPLADSGDLSEPQIETMKKIERANAQAMAALFATKEK
jgi:hypothetical protein